MTRRQSIRKVTAIFRAGRLRAVEDAVLALKVPGISVTRVKGFGEYRNMYAADLLDEHIRVEIFLPRGQAYRVAEAIADAAHTGIEGDGIIVVLPVEALYHIRNKEQIHSRAAANGRPSPTRARKGAAR
ncbi:MAG: P-II family nitrogen regulator [Gemmatimonadota bacterium]|nr:P-II family nitrogen regulator [Gemmatimonadota bacterium]